MCVGEICTWLPIRGSFVSFFLSPTRVLVLMQQSGHLGSSIQQPQCRLRHQLELLVDNSDDHVCRDISRQQLHLYLDRCEPCSMDDYHGRCSR